MNTVIQVNCTYENFTAVKFQWIKDGAIFTPPTAFNSTVYKEESVLTSKNLQGGTFQSLRIQGAEPDLQGYYHCMVRDTLNHTVNSSKVLVRFRGSISSQGPFSREFHIFAT